MLEIRYIYIILHSFFKFNIFFADFYLDSGQNLWVPSCGQFFSFLSHNIFLSFHSFIVVLIDIQYFVRYQELGF